MEAIRAGRLEGATDGGGLREVAALLSPRTADLREPRTAAWISLWTADLREPRTAALIFRWTVGLREPRTVAGITSEPLTAFLGCGLGWTWELDLGYKGADFSTDRTDVNDGSITLAPRSALRGNAREYGWP